MKRIFSGEFKIHVIEMVVLYGKTIREACDIYDLDRQVVHTWIHKYKEYGKQHFLKEHIPVPHEIELRSQQRQIKELEEDKAILKKALAYFGKKDKKNK